MDTGVPSRRSSGKITIPDRASNQSQKGLPPTSAGAGKPPVSGAMDGASRGRPTVQLKRASEGSARFSALAALKE